MNIFFTLLFAANAATSGLDLKVASPNLNYTVSISSGKFLYQSGTRKIQQQIQPCAKRSYDLFARKIEATIKKDYAKAKVKIPKAIQATLNKENFYLPPLSTSGVFVSKLDTDVDYLMSEAIYRCSKK